MHSFARSICFSKLQYKTNNCTGDAKIKFVINTNFMSTDQFKVSQWQCYRSLRMAIPTYTYINNKYIYKKKPHLTNAILKIHIGALTQTFGVRWQSSECEIIRQTSFPTGGFRTFASPKSRALLRSDGSSWKAQMFLAQEANVCLQSCAELFAVVSNRCDFIN